MAVDPKIAAFLRQQKAQIDALTVRINQLSALATQQASKPSTVQEEIDRWPGRRMEGTLGGEITFTANDVGLRAAPVTIQVSQDGPFVMTHYPLVLWFPSAPDSATNLNRWRPVSTYPLPDQVVDTDIIDIKYELIDGGSQRQMQNTPRGPLVSRPDNIVPCPIPTLFSPNSAIQFQPTYLSVTFNGSPNPPTQGTLHVDLVGYRIVNL